MKVKLACTIVICFMIFFSGCSKKTDNVLEIGIMGNLDAIPFIIAQQQNYFGDDIKLTKFASAQDRDSAYHSSNIDGIAADVLAAAFSKEGGINVYVTSFTDGSFTLVAGKDSGITDINQLEGKSTALSQNTIIEYTLDKMLKLADPPVSNIRKEAVPQIPARLEMLNAGKVDSALFPEPFAAAALAAGGTWLADAGEMGIISGVMIFKNESIEDKQALIKKMYEGYNKAVDYINNNDRNEYIDFIISELNFPESVRDTVALPNYRKAQLPDADTVNAAVDWLYERSLIKTKFTYDDLVLDKGLF